jgi:hypothetical protein
MALSKKRRKTWLRSIRVLKEQFSPGVPVEVRTVRLSRDMLGYCEAVVSLGRLKKIEIRLNASQNWDMRYITLAHEWAHAMECESHWNDSGPKRDHGETWGVWFAKIYCCLYEVS